MTMIDELLILLDDLEEVSPDQIPTFFTKPNLQVIFSSLGRLVSRGWVVKKTKRTETTYAISIHGVNELNKTLDVIKADQRIEWDKQWRLVIFDIPETKRKLRDSFRSFLKSEGFGQLKSSVWLSPWDKKELVKRFARRQRVEDQIIQIETGEIKDSYQITLLTRQSWNWSMIEKEHRQFLDVATRQLGQLKKNQDQSRFNAKKLVFQYAEILKQDPLLPSSIAPNANLSHRTYAVYLKLRPFCLSDETA